MRDEINSLYHGIEKFADNLSSTGIDYKLGLVTFGDEIRQVHDFTADISEFREWVRVLNVESGADKKECSLDAMVRGLSLSYREDAQKIMVLVTDAAPHERDDGTSYSSVTKAETIEALRSFGINLFALGPYPFESIARNIGGFWKDIEKNRDFSKILDMIAGIIVEEYLVTYNTTDLTPDLLHEVVVTTMNQAMGTYMSPPSNTVVISTTKIISTGIGAIPEQYFGEGWGFIAAREAAIMDAQKRMLEIIKGVSLRGGQTLIDGVLTDRRMSAAVNGWLNGAYIIEEKYMPTVYLYEVKLGLDLIGETGLINILRDIASYEEAVGNTLGSDILITDLADGWVNATGFGLINKYDSKGKAIYKARAAAIADAQARLLEIIKGTYVESNVQIENALTDVEITKTFEGVIRGAEIVNEAVLAETIHGIEGLYKVEMGVPLTERIGLMGLMINQIGIPENQRINEVAFMGIAAGDGSSAHDNSQPPSESVTYYTGLVINASGMGLQEAMWPRILNERGDIIYSIDCINPNYMGAVFMYSPSITMAKTGKIGDNPIIIKALNCNACDIILDNASVELLKEAVEQNNFLKEGKVSVASGM
jgi:hypothetical protein